MAVPRKKKTTKKAEAATTILTGSMAAPPPKEDNLGHLLKAPVSSSFQATPVCEPNERFFLRHWPREWECEEVDGKACWLPCLGPHILKPGTDNIRTLARHESHKPHLAFEMSVMNARREGWVYIDPEVPVPTECLPDGVPEGGYLRALDCVNKAGVGGTKWVEAWEIPVPTLPGERQQWSFERESYNRWRKHLVESGQVPQPDTQWLNRKRKSVPSHLRSTKAKPLPSDLRLEMVAKHQRRLDMIDNAVVPQASS